MILKLNFFAPISNNLGYGIHSYNLIKSFESRGHRVTLIPPNGRTAFEDEHVQRWLMNREAFSAKDPSVMIFHEEYLSQFSGSPRIGFPVFEMERFTATQIAMLKSCDYLFTPTQWGKKVLTDNGIADGMVRVVNEGYDPELFPFVCTSGAQRNGLPFTFVTVGKYEERKGTRHAVECFARAFTADDSVILKIHAFNPFSNTWLYNLRSQIAAQGFFQCLENQHTIHFKKGRASIGVIQNEFPSQEDVAEFYSDADCGVFLSRAEGWGLPILECAATGVPVICGTWTGMSEYMKDIDSDLLIHEARLVPAKDDIWFDGTRGDWCVPDTDDVVRRMRQVFATSREYRESYFHLGNVQQLREFTWSRAAEQLETALKDVCGL